MTKLCDIIYEQPSRLFLVVIVPRLIVVALRYSGDSNTKHVPILNGPKLLVFDF